MAVTIRRKRLISGLELNKYRVTNILLVSTAYDGFVLEEDGGLYEQIYHHFADLSIPFIPQLTRVSGLTAALNELKSQTYTLVITMFRHNDIDEFAVEREIKLAYPEMPVVLLSYERLSAAAIERVRRSAHIDRVFYWAGDSKILFAIVKSVEDSRNVADDSKFGVQVILVVEDEPAYYSQLLPILYTEILRQTRYLVQHAMNASHGLQRVRMRPKILLAENYEQAVKVIEEYRHNLLGIISDVRFPRGGETVADAGFKLSDYARRLIPGVNFLLQSWETENRDRAEKSGVAFIDKNSCSLAQDFKDYIHKYYGFGSFIFRYPSGEQIAEASDVTEMERIIQWLPAESLYYHASRNHFSTWFRARTEFEVAEKLLALNSDDYPDREVGRQQVLTILKEYFQSFQSGVILDFESFSKKEMENAFIKLGSGSLGGKARGIAFIKSLLSETGLADKYPNIKIMIPRSVVIASDIYSQFMADNFSCAEVIGIDDEEEIARRFLEARLPAAARDNLAIMIDYMDCPLIVRSSSILEDSRVLPFAGIYRTYVLANSHPDRAVRLKQLEDAVKLVYASVYYQSPRHYAKNAGIRIEEEKMAVLIQELAGRRHGDAFYPTLSGVAQSYNFYPFHPSRPEDGTVSLALGLGRAVVEGERVYRYSPAYPRTSPCYNNPREFFENSQTEFYAVPLTDSECRLNIDENAAYIRLTLDRALADGVLRHVGSTFCSESERIYDNVTRAGPKLVTFAPVLKYGRPPLNDVIKVLLAIAKKSFAGDVEIEFAVNIEPDGNGAEFFFLQVRPMVGQREALFMRFDDNRPELCRSGHTVGNAVFDDLRDIIVVKPDKFDVARSREVAEQIGRLNAKLAEEKRRCILIGFGRLGTADPWLGIPLTWAQMSQAMVIIEADTEKLRPEPSLGSHFFHNLTSMNMGYFHIRHRDSRCAIDWQWLNEQPAAAETEFVKLVRSERPFTVMLDGRNFTGRIYR
ncbi:MAG: PEP/pyruvate-binding domain-containing protein [Negativicutes bacterium]|nr:PEP/pyruvate-binding domain-containing protein [Negativicutes bacterium]